MINKINNKFIKNILPSNLEYLQGQQYARVKAT